MKLVVALAALIACSLAQDDCTSNTQTEYTCGGVTFPPSASAEYECNNLIFNASEYRGNESICAAIENLEPAAKHCFGASGVNITTNELNTQLVATSTQAVSDAAVQTAENDREACNNDGDIQGCECLSPIPTEETFCANIVAAIPPPCTEDATTAEVTVQSGDFSFECCLQCSTSTYCASASNVAAEGSADYCQASDDLAGCNDAASTVTAFWM